MKYIPGIVLITMTLGTVIVLGLSWLSPHTLDHQWVWYGGGDSFQQDYGECRSQSLLGGFMSPDYDRTTLNALMRGRGWDLKCKVCDELRW